MGEHDWLTCKCETCQKTRSRHLLKAQRKRWKRETLTEDEQAVWDLAWNSDKELALIPFRV